ncbi:MAG: NYN domain-containing protein [Candidatus Cloacimonetes bacterium]|nr:NYN domain-containing protein [Candidatus Cloacimonadota bacterium]MCF7814318.1 NYN domain-containing protein [Candidatus Cloacimonadota bacterium]MCF7868395.1 NYN domain-containing protein [Candidatus Cloacimonadota bacterium]MCF7883840.1 NYN domain-containing protein [Candidatus Cloacimonadota bacterium]
MDRTGQLRVGVYVDVSNIAHNGGYGMQYDVLRAFACRNNGVAIRLNAYVAYDEEMAKTNIDYKKKSESFHSVLRDFGYKVIVKVVKWYTDEHGNRYGKSNADLDMAVDALMQSERLDYVLIVSGDGDFVQVVRALQNKGCRVEVLAFNNVSGDLKNEADVFTSGYIVPNLSPIELHEPNNGRKIVRGVCYSYNHDKGYGFMRFMKEITGGLWITDSRKRESAYHTAFAHNSQFPPGLDLNRLPNREMIFEFELRDVEGKGLQAENIKLMEYK